MPRKRKAPPVKRIRPVEITGKVKKINATGDCTLCSSFLLSGYLTSVGFICGNCYIQCAAISK